MGEIGNLWVTIGAKTQGLQQGLSQAKKGMKDTQSFAKALGEGMGNLAKLAGLAGAAIGSLVVAYNQTVGATLAYSDQVRELTRLSGANSEESSRMIQMADDLQVSFDSLSVSLKFLARQGVTPSTDELARMSDEYLKLNPGAERAAYLFKNFGRAGTEMSKVLEKGSVALRALAAEQPKALLLTEKQVAAARNLQIQQDAVNDAWAAWKTQIATEIIPVLGEQLELTNRAREIQAAYAEEVGKPMRWQTAYQQAAAQMQEIKTAMDFSTAAKAQMPPILQEIINGSQVAQVELEGVKLGIKDLTMAGIGQETLANLDAALSAGLITQTEYNAAAEYTMRTLLGMSDTDIAGFEKIAGLNADLANSDISAWNYAEAMQAVYTQLAKIKGLGGINLPLATGGNISKQKGGVQEGFGGASGGSFVVPAGYLGDSYAVRASSGEKVTIERNGGKGKSGGVQVYGNITFMVPQGVTTARALFESFQESMSA